MSLFSHLFHHHQTHKENPVSFLEDVAKDVENRFSFHPPTTAEVGQAHDQIRTLLGDVANKVVAIVDTVAPGPTRELSLAVTALDEAMMWANAHIARHQIAPTAPKADEAPPAPAESAPVAPIEAPAVVEPAVARVAPAVPVVDVPAPPAPLIVDPAISPIVEPAPAPAQVGITVVPGPAAPAEVVLPGDVVLPEAANGAPPAAPPVELNAAITPPLAPPGSAPA
jgi:hypothetical protein